MRHAALRDLYVSAFGVQGDTHARARQRINDDALTHTRHSTTKVSVCTHTRTRSKEPARIRKMTVIFDLIYGETKIVFMCASRRRRCDEHRIQENERGGCLSSSFRRCVTHAGFPTRLTISVSARLRRGFSKVRGECSYNVCVCVSVHRFHTLSHTYPHYSNAVCML